ncbi:MoaD/ThiS family protein [Aliikangiella marina]|uniref:MoaD/ThiS family protein n=2 Tax=Aliikangiella marina TaxID=1712262 RepID=A0A545TEQ4_9GAMM|nr:MoaD/ThiS family protein [Aliikangiella marina]
MPRVTFTDNLKRHIECPPSKVSGTNLKEVLDAVFANNAKLGSYILDDQGRLRKHILVSIDNELVKDRINLTDTVAGDSEVYVLQALSGG